MVHCSFSLFTHGECGGLFHNAIKGLVICDDASRITWIEIGWPGSVHDNQVWSNSEIYLDRDKYLDHKKCLIG